MQDGILAQYNDWSKRDGISYDAAASISEDIADITALNICDQFLLDYLQYNKSLFPIQSMSIKEFHIFFASHQKQKISKIAENAQLLTNPHPPNKYRCNVPLSRSALFLLNYNVKKGDGMWWNNQKPIW